MNARRIFTQFFLLVLSGFVQISAYAQTLQYSTIDLSGRVIVTVPSHWFVRDAAGRQDIAAATNAILDPTGRLGGSVHASSLSVLSSADRPQVIFRVSFVNETGSQADLIQDLARGKDAIVRDLAENWKQQASVLAGILERQGGRYLGEERFDIINVGGKKAMLISYRRASVLGGAPFRVSQYHIPMGADKILITASVQESSSRLMQPIVDRMLATVLIHR